MNTTEPSPIPDNDLRALGDEMRTLASDMERGTWTAKGIIDLARKMQRVAGTMISTFKGAARDEQLADEKYAAAEAERKKAEADAAYKATVVIESDESLAKRQAEIDKGLVPEPKT